MRQGFSERIDDEGWPTVRLLATLNELDLAERDHFAYRACPRGSMICQYSSAASSIHMVRLPLGAGRPRKPASCAP
jgi:hypothetical protein